SEGIDRWSLYMPLDQDTLIKEIAKVNPNVVVVLSHGSPVVISESTPGAIGINMSTYAGYTTGGIPGGILASLSLACPSVIIILIIARFLEKFRENKYVNRAFYGLRPASIAMISAAGVNVAMVALFDLKAFQASHFLPDFFVWKGLILAVLIFIGQKKIKIHPVAFIAASALIGIIFKF
ncbi:MAG: chromate transporter, partial [Lachnospiraceae bacterium]|nr:chromate transporter [Lachnospiraceae bacterium]